jgi:L-lysine 6-transaminase
MTPSVTTSARISADQVRAVLDRHMLADGLPVILDLERSHGAYLHDSSRGRELLDLFTCFSTCPLGYNHPGLRDPEFLERLIPAAVNKPSNSDLYTTQMAEFVAAFARTIPAALNERMFFISGGALAVENALKTAFDWKRRKNLAAGRSEKGSQIIHFREAFHGRSGYTLSLTNTDPVKIQYFPKFDWPRISNPKLSFPLTEEVERRVIAAEEEAVREIEAAVARHGHDIAGLIIEPIQGEGGDNHFRREFLQTLRDLADEHEFLLLFDEVQTGFGATGKWWCFEHFDVVPDVLAFGKKTQVCGICAAERVDEVESVFQVSGRINSTWGGNLVDMVRCARTVEIIEQEDLLDNASRVGELLLAGFRSLAGEHPEVVSNVRGRGLFVAFDLPSREIRERLIRAMLDEDLLGLRSGTSAVRFRPPLSLASDDVREGLARLGRAVRRIV